MTFCLVKFCIPSENEILFKKLQVDIPVKDFTRIRDNVMMSVVTDIDDVVAEQIWQQENPRLAL